MAEREYDIVVVGGGVIGLSVAAAVAEEGARTVVLERTTLGAGASEGNAGLIVPSYSLPLATAGNLGAGIRSLYGPDEGVSIALNPQLGLLRWAVLFARACRPSRVARGTRALAELSAEGLELHERFAGRHGNGAGFKRARWLHVYRTQRGLEEALRTAELLEAAGVTSERVDAIAARDREPMLDAGIRGGVSFSGQASVEPEALVESLEQVARAAGAEIRTGVAVRGLVTEGRRLVGVKTDGESLAAARVVVAAGAWSGVLLRPLGIRLPMLPGKGVSVTAPVSGPAPNEPLLFGERHVVVTPFTGRVRLTTGLRLGDWTNDLTAGDRMNFERALAEYLREPLRTGASWQEWAGLRPLTPDGLPVIGPTKRYPNLFLATGHGALGVTLCLSTAKAIADAVHHRRQLPQELQPARFNV
jgi:D-amino-acid dehydrogenase